MSRAPPSPVWCLGLAVVLGASLPRPAGAQQDTAASTVRGLVLDRVTGQPVEDVRLSLWDSTGRAVDRASSDRSGRFVLRVIGGGTYRIHGERVGYRAGESPSLTLGPGDSSTVELRLEPTPFLLDTVLVNVARALRPLHTGEQLIRGKVIDSETGTPVPYGTVRLLWEGRSPVVTVLTKNDGTFRLVSPRAGTYELRAGAMGYETASSKKIFLQPGDTIDVTFRLGVDAVVLDPLTVTASARPWENRHEMVGMEPFFERYARYGGSGYSEIMTRDSLKRWQNKVQSTGAMLEWATPLVRQADPVTGAMTLRGSCTPTYYLNNAEVPYSDVRSLSPVLLEAVEVYMRPSIPAELAADNPCGVVAFWSRQSPPDKLPPNKIGRKLAIGVVLAGLVWLLIKVHGGG